MTLFVQGHWRSRLDGLRELLDPVQALLIGAHVTLCREDEIEHLESSQVFSRIAAWPHGALRLSFGPPMRFGGHGALLPCILGTGQFQSLRQSLLQDPCARAHAPHLTLAHPRNPLAVGNTETALAYCPPELELEFASVALIEQVGRAPWRCLQEADLQAKWPRP